jgi:hypothetical protein
MPAYRIWQARVVLNESLTSLYHLLPHKRKEAGHVNLGQLQHVINLRGSPVHVETGQRVGKARGLGHVLI